MLREAHILLFIEVLTLCRTVDQDKYTDVFEILSFARTLNSITQRSKRLVWQKGFPTDIQLWDTSMSA